MKKTSKKFKQVKTKCPTYVLVKKKEKIWALVGNACLAIGGVLVGFLIGNAINDPKIALKNSTGWMPMNESANDRDIPTPELDVGFVTDYWKEEYGRSAIVTDLHLKDVPSVVTAFAKLEGEDRDVNVVFDFLDMKEEERK